MITWRPGSRVYRNSKRDSRVLDPYVYRLSFKSLSLPPRWLFQPPPHLAPSTTVSLVLRNADNSSFHTTYAQPLQHRQPLPIIRIHLALHHQHAPATQGEVRSGKLRPSLQAGSSPSRQKVLLTSEQQSCLYPKAFQPPTTIIITHRRPAQHIELESTRTLH